MLKPKSLSGMLAGLNNIFRLIAHNLYSIPSFFFRMSFTACGFALPCISFIT